MLPCITFTMAEEFEIFLDADHDDNDSSLIDIVCVPPSSKRTAAQRRWRLLKNMAHAQYQMKRLTSLTDKEQHLLDNLESKDALPSTELCDARQSIRATIYSKGKNLTSVEVEFLHRLTEAPNVTTEQLERTHAVLLLDPVFEQREEEEDSKEEREAAQERRRSLESNERDASFRTQVWEYCGSDNGATSSNSSFSYRFQGAHDSELQLDFPVVFSVLGTSLETVGSQPHVLSPPIMDALRSHLPYVVQQDNFWLKYSAQRDGLSLRTLLQKSRGSARTIVAIETMDGDILGSFTSSPWREQGQQYYGSGEAFLWRLPKVNSESKSVEDQAKLEGQVEFFEWSGENRNVQRLVNVQSNLIVGGGGPDDGNDNNDNENHGSGLVLSPCLTRGHSHSCLTFGSPSLTLEEGEMFEITNVEVWTLTPVDTLEQAERVELSRHFVFDQGNFALA